MVGGGFGNPSPEVIHFMSKLRGLIKGMLRITFNKASRPIGIQIDTTYRCNLRCKHCYFMEQGYHDELTTNQWLNKIEELQNRFHFLHCTWVGGEPLLRLDLLDKGTKYFDLNWVVTNGTLAIPNLKGCNFFVSIDGTKRYHELIRGKETYDRTARNITSSKAKISLVMTVNSINYRCISDMLEEWCDTNVVGITFMFHTPLGTNDNLFISLKQRDKILDRIGQLKGEYGDFILLSDGMIEGMRSDNCKRFVGENCVFKKMVMPLDPMGRVKQPCILRDVDCSNCGCIQPYAFSLLLRNDFETMRVVLKTIG